MTLPIQPLCADAGLHLRAVPLRRKPCFSAVWADTSVRKENRRAVCSWSVGYGSLSECENNSRKVADSAALLEPRGRRLATSIPLPHAQVSNTNRRPRNRFDILTMPGIKSLVKRRRNSGETVETSSPLVRRNGSGGNLIRPTVSLASLRKCETVLALTNALRSSSSSTSSVEPMQPTNRLRFPPSPHGSTVRMCSRCSSLLTLASSSRYSLNTSTGGFIPVPDDPPLLCKLCLVEVPSKDACQIQQCNCSFCKEVKYFFLFSLILFI